MIRNVAENPVTEDKFVAARVLKEEQAPLIVPEPKPGLSMGQKMLLTGALLLAVSAMAFAGLFQRASVTDGGSFNSGVAQCPMGSSS